MRSFKKGSACGRDGFWPQYYLDILTCAVSRDLQDYIRYSCTYHNLCLSGQLPRSLAPYIASAPLTLLRKLDGRFRPIAVGEAERRLTSKLAMQSVRGEAKQYLSPLQFGVGVSNESIRQFDNVYLRL